MATIFHLAFASDWAAAQEAGAYTMSTRGRTLAEEGFIHCSRGDQWTGVRERFYADVTEPLLLLQIDTAALDVPVVEEPPAPGVAETFPHVYGPLPVAAVVKAIPLALVVEEAGHGLETLAAQAPRPPEAQAPRPPEENAPRPPEAHAPRPPGDFSQAFLGEMFGNLAVAVVVLACCVVGSVAARAAYGEDATVVGALVGLVVGGVLGRWLYVRRRRRAAP